MRRRFAVHNIFQQHAVVFTAESFWPGRQYYRCYERIRIVTGLETNRPFIIAGILGGSMPRRKFTGTKFIGAGVQAAVAVFGTMRPQQNMFYHMKALAVD